MASALTFYQMTASPSFEDFVNERLRNLSHSIREYDLLLHCLDALIKNTENTLEHNKQKRIKKTVRFKEQNKVFLIPPRNEIPLFVLPSSFENFDDLFPDLFYRPFP